MHRLSVLWIASFGAGWLELSLFSADPSRSFFSPAFPNGIASGDVDATSVVLWARAAKPGTITFTYSIHPNFLLLTGIRTTNVTEPMRPAKVEIEGLAPGTTYFFRATDAAGEFLDGQFRTAAAPGTFRGLRFGVSGDWQGQLAPFPSVSDVPDRDLDFFVALGDTIYADVLSPAVPDKPAQDLVEFRAKHDEILSERIGLNVMAHLRGTTAIYATVDDHEWTNGIAGGAAVRPGEYPDEPSNVKTVSQTAFFRTGLQAFLEYQPITDRVYQVPEDLRTHGRVNLYRSRRFGSDAALFVLDARSFRDAGLKPPSSPFNTKEWARFEAVSLELDPDTGAALPHRTLLGSTQFSTLTRDLLCAEAEGAIWKFILMPEPIQNLGLAGADDRYEGYAAERLELMKLIHTTPIANVVFISADLHGTLINNVTYRLKPGGTNIDSGAFEIVTGAVAHDQPFGPTAFDYAASVKVTPAVSLLQLLLTFIGIPNRSIFNALPLAEKDTRFESVVNILLNAVGLDPLGFDGTDIDARWDLGRPVVAHSYGWSEFEIDRDTHELVVTTRGIAAYSAGELSPENISVKPQILSRFRVRPRALPPRIHARIEVVPNGISISWRGDAILESRDSVAVGTQWQPAPEHVENEAADFVVRITVSEQCRFFRLRPRNR